MILYETTSTWIMFIHHHPAVHIDTSQKWLAHEFEPRVCNFR